MIIGNEDLIADLKKLAERERASHGYIFWGAERIGKRTIALAFANYLENGAFEEIFDVKGNQTVILHDCLPISPDTEGKIGIDAARGIQKFLFQKPNRSSRRAVIIDQSFRLTGEAQDALLKISENPPESSLIVLITTSPERLKPTLASRFQSIYVKSVPTRVIAQWLVREWGLAQGRAAEIASRSLNQPGRAWAYASGSTLREREATAKKLFSLSGNARSALIKELTGEETFDIEDFLDSLIEFQSEEKNYELWHRILKLREAAEYFNINSRLQLEALFKN